MRSKTPWVALIVLAVALVGEVTSASAQSSSPPVPSASSAMTGDPVEEDEQLGPVGVIALGHSGLTGENTVPERPYPDPVLENSWATGTAPEVDSIYRRLVAVRPETEGHVANAAVGGAPSDTLVDQARAALAQVPNPALVLIQTIDGDIRCDGSDADHVPEFGQNVAEVLDVITSESPDSRILMVGQSGRPLTYAAAIADVPDVVASMTGTGRCYFFDESGDFSVEQVAELTAIIEGYHAEQARVCARFEHCRTDGGLMASWVDDDVVLSDDWNHLSAEGHARKAAMLWPLVAGLLHIPT